jgi:hypothetical protein
MFKQVLLKGIIPLIIVTIVLIFILKKPKLILNPEVFKYPLTEKSHFSKSIYLNDLKKLNEIAFYTNLSWSTKNNNYIYDKKLDRYYIIEPGYYYYIPDSKRIKLKINKNIKVFYLEKNKQLK